MPGGCLSIRRSAAKLKPRVPTAITVEHTVKHISIEERHTVSTAKPSTTAGCRGRKGRGNRRWEKDTLMLAAMDRRRRRGCDRMSSAAHEHASQCVAAERKIITNPASLAPAHMHSKLQLRSHFGGEILLLQGDDDGFHDTALTPAPHSPGNGTHMNLHTAPI
ncbi:hypothetical protein B0H10DRAFT_1998792 [Mycena sp. CBHHK59/15]|nr:hypothetical protein B0H10DRAFT_1998792 [Mycena sp. CBHHK59/15]